MESEYEEQADTLSLLLASSMGWVSAGSPWESKLAMVRSSVDKLGHHGIQQALALVNTYPDGAIKDATFALLSKGTTDPLAFLGVERWTHHSLLTTVRQLNGGTRYQYDDFLQAPAHILSEARALVGITNLCLSGELSNGVDNTSESSKGNGLEYSLNNDGLVSLVQRYPAKGDEIIQNMRKRNTLDAMLIEQVLTTTNPLVMGVL